MSAATLDELRRQYDVGRDVDLRALIVDGGMQERDELLSDVIDADGRIRLERGLPVELTRYVSAVPGLAGMGESLDTAIEMSLRALRAKGHSQQAAAELLVAGFPGIEREIRTASMLEDVLCSTGGLRRSLADVGRTLPQEFGPTLREGRKRYELRELVGTGAHGAVYLAADRQLSDPDRPAWVAIKILTPLGEADETRLADEATKARRVDHPNVVRVLDRGLSEEGEPYLAYEYVRGGDLTAFASALPGPIPERQAAQLVAKMARGLQAAHSAGLAHCDLKPANVLITDAGEPKVADFGVAVRLAGVDGQSVYQRLGSMAFVAPEQYRGEPGSLSPLADTYAVGGILYWLLTRKYPNGDTPEEVNRNLDGPGARAEAPDARTTRPIDPDLAAICSRALQPDQRKRYASAEALAVDLETWLRHEPLRWVRSSPVRKASLIVRRQPLAVGLTGALTLAVFVGVSTGVYLHLRSVRIELENQVALAEQRATADRARLLQANNLLASTAKLIASFRGNSDDWMPVMTIAETMAGPALAGDGLGADAWSVRIDVISQLLAQAKAEHRESELEPLLWQTVLGYWLLRAGKVDEAAPLLHDSRERWAVRTGPSDPWLASLDAMIECVGARRALASKSEPAMREAAQRLAVAGPKGGSWKNGRLIYRLVLQTQSDLHGPDGLNDPAKYMEFQEALKAAK